MVDWQLAEYRPTIQAQLCRLNFHAFSLKSKVHEHISLYTQLKQVNLINWTYTRHIICVLTCYITLN